MIPAKDWRMMFTVEQIDNSEKIQTQAYGDCNANCLEAKELVCVCRCHGKNHGARLKEHVRSLDTYQDPTEDDPVTESFNPEQYVEELAVLA